MRSIYTKLAGNEANVVNLTSAASLMVALSSSHRQNNIAMKFTASWSIWSSKYNKPQISWSWLMSTIGLPLVWDS